MRCTLLSLSALSLSALSLSAGVAACSPSPQDAAMTHPGPPSTASRAAAVATTPTPGAIPQTETPAEAAGRRILSTAFVMIGPDGHLTVEQRGGEVVVLRDVVMRAADYCGVRATGDAVGRPWCGAYAGVAAARPGGAPVGRPDPGADGTGVAATPARNP